MPTASARGSEPTPPPAGGRPSTRARRSGATPPGALSGSDLIPGKPIVGCVFPSRRPPEVAVNLAFLAEERTSRRLSASRFSSMLLCWLTPSPRLVKFELPTIACSTPFCAT